MANDNDLIKALLAQSGTYPMAGPNPTPSTNNNIPYYNSPMDPMKSAPSGDLLSSIDSMIKNSVATAPAKKPAYPLSPVDPMGTAMDIVDPSGTMRASPLSFLATIPQGPKVPMRMDSQMEPPMGMAESLRQRSGDDLPKPTAAPAAAKKADTKAKPKVGVPGAASDLEPARLNDVLNNPTGSLKGLEGLEKEVPPTEEELAMQSLIDAQNKAGMNSLLLGLGRAGEKIGTGIAGVRSDASFLDDLEGGVNKPVTDYQTQRAVKEQVADRALKNAAEERAKSAEGRAMTAEERAAKGFDLEQEMKQFNFGNLKESEDPNSPASEFARASLGGAAAQVGLKINIPKNVSAAELQRQLPYISNMITAKMAQDSKLETARIRNEDKAEKNKEKKVQEDSKKTERYRNRLNEVTKTQQNIFDQRNQMIQDVEEFIANPNGAKGFRDIALTYGFIKGRDDSAVREGEIALLGAAGSLPDRIRRSMNRALKGETYNVADMRALAEVLATENKSLKKAYQARAKNVLNQAKKENLDVNDIIRTDMMDMDEPKTEQQSDGMVTVREKSSGRMKKLSAADAQKVLADPRFEQVK